MYFNFLFINPKILLILLKKEFPTLYLPHTYYQKIHDKNLYTYKEKAQIGLRQTNIMSML